MLDPVKVAEFQTSPPSVRADTLLHFRASCRQSTQCHFIQRRSRPLRRSISSFGPMPSAASEVTATPSGEEATASEDPRPTGDAATEAAGADPTASKYEILSAPLDGADVELKSFDNPKVLIVKKASSYYLKASLDVNLPRGFRVAGVGGGRMSQQKGAHAIQLEMLQGDKTWVEVSHGVEDGEEGVKKGTEHRATLYQVVKELRVSSSDSVSFFCGSCS